MTGQRPQPTRQRWQEGQGAYCVLKIRKEHTQFLSSYWTNMWIPGIVIPHIIKDDGSPSLQDAYRLGGNASPHRVIRDGTEYSNSRCLPCSPSLHLNQTLFRRLTPPSRSNRVGIMAETGAIRCQKVILFVPETHQTRHDRRGAGRLDGHAHYQEHLVELRGINLKLRGELL